MAAQQYRREALKRSQFAIVAVFCTIIRGFNGSSTSLARA
jgi:hypothetical protein